MTVGDPASLQNLNDIVAPAVVPLLPPAPGWYLVGSVLALLLVWSSVRRWQRWRSNAYRRHALAFLSACDEASAREFPALLKRCALSAWPREQVAALSGSEWHAFLDRTAATERFMSGSGGLLEKVAYAAQDSQPLTEQEFQRLRDDIVYWLINHRAEQGAA